MELLLAVIVGSFVVSSLYLVLLLNRAHQAQTAPKNSNTTELPSVSVCIPARNEAHALSACLDRVLASDYEKLEVLVLDDESIDRTPTLIKSFAHAGVRFIAGKPLPDSWIGKNHALDTLAHEASGDIVLFLDVDVHVSPQSITQLISAMPADSQVVSVIPQRRDTYRASALFGHMRYFWDMIYVGMGHKSASASLWAVRREWLLTSFNGLERVHDVIRPELAVVSAKQTKSVFFLGEDVQVSYEKHWHSQVESSERLLVPTVRQYSPSSILTTVWLVLSIVTTVMTVVLLLTQPSIITISLFYAALISGYVVSYTYLRAVWWSRAWLGAMMWWWTSAQELVLLLISLIRYATKTVTWKGRSIHAQPQNDDYYSV